MFFRLHNDGTVRDGCPPGSLIFNRTSRRTMPVAIRFWSTFRTGSYTSGTPRRASRIAMNDDGALTGWDLKKHVVQRIDQANGLGREEATSYSEASSAAPTSQLTFAVAVRGSLTESRRLVARSGDENKPHFQALCC